MPRILFIVVFDPLPVHLPPVTTMVEEANSKQRTKKAEPGNRWKASYLDKHCESSEADACGNVLEEEEAPECPEEMGDEAEEEGDETDAEHGQVEKGKEESSEAGEESATLPIEAAAGGEHMELLGGEGQLQHQRENPPNKCRCTHELQVALCRMSRCCLRPRGGSRCR